MYIHAWVSQDIALTATVYNYNKSIMHVHITAFSEWIDEVAAL